EVRPSRDRSSGGSWRGLGTMVHVSALLAAAGPVTGDLADLAGTLDAALEELGLHRSDGPLSSLPQARWRDDQGFVAELLAPGVVALRVISGAFLPGSLEPLASTSPLTPPPRPAG